MSAKPVEQPAEDPLAVSEEDIDAILYEAKDDVRDAIRMLLRDLAVMALDADAATSRGFLKGKFSTGRRRAPWIDEA